MKETICVLAISTKKERGWLKVSTPLRDSWADLGMHFDKVKFGTVFVAPGLYDVELLNNAKFGGNAAYEVISAHKIGTFAELIESTKGK
ncbi:hypothetical protein BFC22_05220 [Carnobacterium divergens]|uniref:Uncharacterized protein n=1 Tax=Carnobacterium maltaromaticum TaxID=2751 RepID=A0AAW9JTX1_CARML|nr:MULTISPECIES: hypothetical protein [Carnobacterium]ANZ99527.1 hypothetical protein BFC22_05220 [Carnobacterium divergens]MDZ5758958.1 hypothetical protein [Carnobacterium maltaromaticum]